MEKLESAVRICQSMSGVYMATIISILSGHDISMHTRHGNYSNKSKLALYKLLLHFNTCLNSCSEVTQQSASVIKVGVVDIDVHVLSHLKEALALSVDKRL